MARTLLEKNIRHKRKRTGILVPIIEDRLKWPIRIETRKDAKFIEQLVEKMRLREEEREDEEKGYYSPSALSECLRRVFLTRNHRQFEIPRVFVPRTDMNFYFLNGEFLHLKWDFALYKIAQEFPEIELAPDPIDSFEIKVQSKRGDHRGTIDAIPEILGEEIIVDWKGLNVRSFSKISKGDLPEQYRIQIADYLMLLNSERPKKFSAKRGLLVAENKGGPDNNFPAALCEQEVTLADSKRELHLRLEVLRQHEKENSIPPPECVSTKSTQFKDCPFQKYCKEEIKEIERREFARSHADGYSVRIPEKRRSSRAGRNRSR